MLLPTTDSRWYGATIALCCLLLVVPNLVVAQNLVPNPSFELIDTCPHIPPVAGYGLGSRPLYWFSASDTPDYFNACVDSFTSVPNNFAGFQFALDGEAYSGHATYLSGNHREMLSAELITPLVVGQTYYASMYLNTSQGGIQPGDIGCSNVGMLFTTTRYEWFQGLGEFPLTDFAHVYSQLIVSDTLDWVLTSGSFVADSAYRYVVLGNHFHNSLTDTTSVGPFMGGVAYHFVDQVCVSPDPNGCPLINGIESWEESNYRIGPNPTNGAINVYMPYLDDWFIQVSDLVGRTLHAKTFRSSDREQILLPDLAAGGYVISIQNAQGKHALKFLKW